MNSLTNYLWFFIIYAFLGWWIEVAFHAVTEGKFMNRGFLNGPVCPIYGFGMIILLYFLSPLADNFMLLFIGSVILTSALEFITGFVLEKVFNDKWWDYSNRPFNIKGYICLSFSIMWGLAAVFVINIVHPSIFNFISFFNNNSSTIMLILFISYFIADFIVTLLGILKINKQYRLLEEMAARLRLYSDGIGEDIYKRVSSVVEATDKINQKIQDSKSEFEDLNEKDLPELQEKYNKMIEEKHFVHRRLEKAYPNIKEKLSKLKHNHKTK